MKKEEKDWFIDKFTEGRKPYIWIVFIGLLVYFWTIFFTFSYFDDKTLILDNLFYLKNLGNIFNAFSQEVFHVLHTSAAYYRPVLTISFILDAQISGSSAFFYHVTNIAIHLVASCLVFVFLCKLKVKRELALIFAIIFVVHPVLSQAVAWIPGRNDSLLALFFLASMIRAIEAFSGSGNTSDGDRLKRSVSLGFSEVDKRIDIVWHLIFFALALFTKESGILIPFFVILWLFLLKKPKVVSINHLEGGLGMTPCHLLTFFGWLVIAIAWFFLRKNA